VCSILGAAPIRGSTPGGSAGIDRIAEAIDQLETDLKAASSAPEISARVAGIWLMVTELDPELSRLVARYTTPGSPADGTGSLQAYACQDLESPWPPARARPGRRDGAKPGISHPGTTTPPGQQGSRRILGLRSRQRRDNGLYFHDHALLSPPLLSKQHMIMKITRMPR
jgi:hypothetical protein